MFVKLIFIWYLAKHLGDLTPVTLECVGKGGVTLASGQPGQREYLSLFDDLILHVDYLAWGFSQEVKTILP